MMRQEFNVEEMRWILESTIASNIHNRKNNARDKNVAIRFVGEHGIGKTEVVIQTAVENNYAYKYMNLSEITEESSLYGFPRETYKISKIDEYKADDNTTKSRKLIKNIRVGELSGYLDKGWVQESKDSELTYSIPQWVRELEKTSTSLLILDEFGRAQPYIMQAVMNLILFGKFGTWELPKGTQIVILDNPDDGNYNVASLDDAQKTRFLSYFVKGDVNAWVKWASKSNIHEECINFLYKTPEAVTKSNTDSLTDYVPSYRVWTMFFERISHISNLNDPNYLREIKIAGIGSIGEKMLNLFKLFVDNNLGAIPSLHEVFSNKTSVTDSVKLLKSSIYEKDQLRNDIKGLIGIRLIGYCSNPNNLTDNFFNKFEAIISQNVITSEIIIRIFKDLGKSNPKIYDKFFAACPSITGILTKNHTI